MEIASILFFILVIIYFSFFVTLIFVSKKIEKKGVVYFYTFCLLQALILLAPALLFLQVNISYSAYISGPIKVILTPLLFLYFKKLATKDKRIKANEFWHFLPFILDLILTLIIAPGHADKIVSNNDLKITEIFKVSIDGNFYYNILAITARTIALVQGFFYSYHIYKLFQKYALGMRQASSVISTNNLFWIRLAAVLIALKGLVSGGALFGFYTIPLVFLVMVVFMIFFGFYFFNHAMIQPDISFIGEANLNEVKKTDLEEYIEHEIDLQILELFKEKKLYLKPDLTLQEVSDELAVAKYKLTKIIKIAGYLNFYAFVNEQRIEHSKELLNNLPKNLSLESVVTDSGFQARSTYYRVFKEMTGFTPKEFMLNKENNNP